MDDVATQVEEDRYQTINSTSVRCIAASVEQSRSTVHKNLRKVRRCDPTTVFMQDGAPPHISHCVKQLLRHHFSDDRTISWHFPTAWLPRSLLLLAVSIPQERGLP
ncbi:hypothetical protein TNCV_3245351 [Trichonephila clavipes]|nr:hypothetical protein TNCV_3245351 [Trichonephila clavipes]